MHELNEVCSSCGSSLGKSGGCLLGCDEKTMTTKTNDAEHTPEQWDVYKSWRGPYTMLLVSIDGSWTGVGNRWNVSYFENQVTQKTDREIMDFADFLGNALERVNACADLGPDPAARIKELQNMRVAILNMLDISPYMVEGLEIRVHSTALAYMRIKELLEAEKRPARLVGALEKVNEKCKLCNCEKCGPVAKEVGKILDDHPAPEHVVDAGEKVEGAADEILSVDEFERNFGQMYDHYFMSTPYNNRRASADQLRDNLLAAYRAAVRDELREHLSGPAIEARLTRDADGRYDLWGVEFEPYTEMCEATGIKWHSKGIFFTKGKAGLDESAIPVEQRLEPGGGPVKVRLVMVPERKDADVRKRP